MAQIVRVQKNGKPGYEAPVNGKPRFFSDEKYADIDAVQVRIKELTQDAQQPDEPSTIFERSIQNAPSSAKNLLIDTIEPFKQVAESVVTGEVPPFIKTIGDIGRGVFELIRPGEHPDEEKARAVGRFFADRYGGWDAIKETFATDPVGMAADLGMVLSAGAIGVGRVPGAVGKVARVAGTVGDMTDPLSAGLKVAGKTAPALSAVMTGAGIPASYRAIDAGRRGGDAAREFLRNLRGRAPADEVVDSARAAVEEIRIARSEQYKRGMRGVSRDKTALDFDPISAALNNAKSQGRYKDVPLASDREGTIARLENLVEAWKSLDPAEYHTPEGLDALKRAVWELGFETKRGTIEGKMIGTVANAIKDQIQAQAPAYAKVMDEYTRASEVLRDLEHGFGTGVSAFGNREQALRRLQSIMRNNANTNYGRRAELGDILEGAGAKNLRYQLAGQQMQSLLPRGLQSALATGAGLGALVDPRTLAALPFMSPRLAGEGLFALGRVGGPTRGLLDVSFQAGRLDRNDPENN